MTRTRLPVTVRSTGGPTTPTLDPAGTAPLGHLKETPVPALSLERYRVEWLRVGRVLADPLLSFFVGAVVPASTISLLAGLAT